jgi:hypothetical protein
MGLTRRLIVISRRPGRLVDPVVPSFLLPILEPMHKQPPPTLPRAVYTLSNYPSTSSIPHQRSISKSKIQASISNIVQTSEQRKERRGRTGAKLVVPVLVGRLIASSTNRTTSFLIELIVSIAQIGHQGLIRTTNHD